MSVWRWVLHGFTRRSALALAGVLLTYAVIGFTWRNLIDPSQGMDWLLGGIWVLMTGALVWRMNPRHDLKLVFVGMCGGAVIEWWGTNTNLWVYFTLERPPLWIIPAWPIAGITVDRLSRLTERALPGLDRLSPAYWLVLPAFVLVMTRFLWPTIDTASSQLVVALMVGVTCIGARPQRDLRLFLVGATLGIFLEYWGTSRRCWTYYTRELPPYEAVLAHGFASIAFARAVQSLDALVARVRPSDAPSPLTGEDPSWPSSTTSATR